MFRVLCLDEVDSTNNVVKDALRSGEPEGLVVRAWRQSGGYGRQGRAWTSPLGGLYCSWLLRPDVPPEQLPTLSLVVGLAFRRALASLAGGNGGRVLVKWPNDVVLVGEGGFPAGAGGSGASGSAVPSLVLARAGVDSCDSLPLRNRSGAADPLAPSRAANQDRSSSLPGNRSDDVCPLVSVPAEIPAFSKLVGISLEAVGGGVCVGTGVNVVRPAGGAVSVGGKNVAGYVSDVAPSLAAEDTKRAVEAVFEMVAASLEECYGLWAREGFGAFSDEFDACHVLAGCSVGVDDRRGNALGRGVARCVDERGRLVLADAAGAEVRIASGEAHIV